jgi:hypothetical protein
MSHDVFRWSGGGVFGSDERLGIIGNIMQLAAVARREKFIVFIGGSDHGPSVARHLIADRQLLNQPLRLRLTRCYSPYIHTLATHYISEKEYFIPFDATNSFRIDCAKPIASGMVVPEPNGRRYFVANSPSSVGFSVPQ